MLNLWYITFHGGSSGITNIYAWDKSGGSKPTYTDVLDTSDIGHHLHELRGFFVAPPGGPNTGHLYVTHSYKDKNPSESIGEILHFDVPQSSGMRKYLGQFCVWSSDDNPGLQHPFDVVIGPDGNVYVANQGQKNDPEGTNAVIYYQGLGSSHPGEPVSTPKAKYPGTFVPPEGAAKHGVQLLRDAIFGPYKENQMCMYLSDEKRNEVRRYDLHGTYIDSPVTGSDGLDKPVHLLVSQSRKHLYIGSQKNNSVLKYDFSTGKTETLVDATSGIDSTGGMGENGDGWLYVASREGKQILRFDHASGKPDTKPFIPNLGDNPEFIQWV